MTHEELMAEIERLEELVAQVSARTDVYPALRAVVELHKPVYWQGIEMVCDWCDITSYPCPTIQAIRKELG